MLQRTIEAGAVVCAAAICKVAINLPRHLQVSLVASAALSLLGFFGTTSASHGMGAAFIKAGLKGIDLNKHTTKRDREGALVRPIEGIAIPESQGTVAATVFIIVMSVFIPFHVFTYGLGPEARKGQEPSAAIIGLARLSEYLAASWTITLASFMGFADDVLDLRWRHKIPLPFLATLPLLFVYYANSNETGVMVPNQLRFLLGDFLDLGVLFYVFLLILAVFSTHAINIYAGVNGLEVGQAVVVAVSVLILNIIQLSRIPDQHHEYREHQVQSLFLLLPFLAVSLALLRLNWFPARVFVGDTYCYFAGMTLAVVCIVGHYSKTMVILLLPQLLNFLYSVPQLVKFIGIHQPRHRMPAYDTSLGYVKNSYCEFTPSELPSLGKIVFWILKTFKLAHIKPQADGTVQMSNLTLINFALYVLGPCREDMLCIRLLAFQVFCSALCFCMRFGVASYLFDVVL